MMHLTWKMPTQAPFTNGQKILALAVMLPSIPFLAMLCSLFSPRLRLQESIITMGPMATALLAATAGAILLTAVCVPGAYKRSSIYIGAFLGIYFVITAGIHVAVLGTVTWIVVALCAALLSYQRTNASPLEK